MRSWENFMYNYLKHVAILNTSCGDYNLITELIFLLNRPSDIVHLLLHHLSEGWALYKNMKLFRIAYIKICMYGLWTKISFTTIHYNTECPKIKLTLEKCLETAPHESWLFKMCILNVKRDKLGPNHSGPLLSHPWMHSINLEPIWTPQVFPEVRITNNCWIS